MLYIGKLDVGTVGTCFAQQDSKTDKVRRGQRTKHVLDVLPFKNNCHPATRTSTVLPGSTHWGVACIPARADVYAMTIRLLMTRKDTIRIISMPTFCRF